MKTKKSRDKISKKKKNTHTMIHEFFKPTKIYCNKLKCCESPFSNAETR